MPRRNRTPRAKPRDLTSEEPPMWRPGNPPSPGVRRYIPVQVQERTNAEKQRDARMQSGIDWMICLVPGCGRKLLGYGEGRVHEQDRDPDRWLPMCHHHAAVVARTFNRFSSTDTRLQEAAADVNRLHDEVTAKRERAFIERDQGGPGVIYFLRQNGLVKIGWSSDIYKRFRSYGPNVEILCHYPGSRQDETTLHRQLRDHLAKGREWYHDDDAIALFVNDALKRYGPPTILPMWTQPKPPTVASKRSKGVG